MTTKTRSRTATVAPRGRQRRSPDLDDDLLAEVRVAAQQNRLAALEAVIEEGLPRFVEVGQALEQIRADKLWREGNYASWEHYCLDRWKFSASRARQLIAAFRAVTAGNATGAANEKQARDQARTARGDDVDDLRAQVRAARGRALTKADLGDGLRLAKLAPLWGRGGPAGLGGSPGAEMASRITNADLNDDERRFLRAALPAWGDTKAIRAALRRNRRPPS